MMEIESFEDVIFRMAKMSFSMIRVEEMRQEVAFLLVANSAMALGYESKCSFLPNAETEENRKYRPDEVVCRRRTRGYENPSSSSPVY
jgi:hypothetical protein